MNFLSSTFNKVKDGKISISMILCWVLINLIFSLIFSPIVDLIPWPPLTEDGPYSASVQWIWVPNPDFNRQPDTRWYYAPNYTKINPDGSLDTWIKDENSHDKNVIPVHHGSYGIKHYNVDVSFSNYKELASTDFKANGELRKNHWLLGGGSSMPKSAFANCLREALNFAKSNNVSASVR